MSGSPGALEDSAGSFPGIMDAMFIVDQDPSPENWDLVKQQLALATYKISSAAKLLTI